MPSPSRPPTNKEKIDVAMPLFGGGDAYLETLGQILDFVEVASVDKRELIQWFKTNFPNVSSDNSISRRISFLQSLQFITTDDGTISVGPAGRRYNDSRSSDVVYNILAANVGSIESLLGHLCQGQVDIETLEESLDHDYDRVKWKLNWLRSLGFANQVDGDSYIATEEGKDAFRVYSSPNSGE